MFLDVCDIEGRGRNDGFKGRDERMMDVEKICDGFGILGNGCIKRVVRVG